MTPKAMTQKIHEKFDTPTIRRKVQGMGSTYEMIKAAAKDAGENPEDYDRDGFIGEVQELIKENDPYRS